MSGVSWDTVAETYASTVTSFTTLHATDMLEAIKPTLLKPSTETVLDIGCGGGAFAIGYLRTFPKGITGQTVICSDMGEKMVEQTRQKVTASLPDGYATRFEFRVLDALDLSPIAAGSVQAVVSAFCLFLIPDRAKAFQQVVRVLDASKPSVLATTAWTYLPEGFNPRTVSSHACKSHKRVRNHA